MKEIERKRFEVKLYTSEDGMMQKAVFIDNCAIDYSIDISSYLEAVKMGPQYRLAVQKDIEKHFASCVSDVLGRKVTVDDIKEAIKTGWI